MACKVGASGRTRDGLDQASRGPEEGTLLRVVQEVGSSMAGDGHTEGHELVTTKENFFI